MFVGIIDVPGHERFVRQMVAGAGGIDLALLLVAADEGVMPQTREHLDVLRALDVRHGVVVISKSDLATDDTLPLLKEEIAELVRGTFLEGAPVIEASARTGAGLDALRASLLAIARGIESRDASGPFRLAIDRVFHQKGIGVVVTGSGYSGRVAVGDELDLLPSGLRVRVREVQSFGAKRAQGTAGERLALALHGVKLDQIARGDTLATPGRFVASRTVDVRITLTALDDIVLKNRERVRVHHGARELLGRVVLLNTDDLGADGTALAQLRLESPMVTDAGDRLVFRRYSPPRVIAGGRVIDARADVHRRHDASVIERLTTREQGDPETILARMIERAGMNGLVEADIDAETAAPILARGDATAIAGRVFARDALDALAERAIALATQHTSRHPLQWGIDKEELRRRVDFPHPAALFNRVIDVVSATHPLFVREDRVRAGDSDIHLTPGLRDALAALDRALEAAGVAFLSRAEAERAWSAPEPFAEAARYLREANRAVEVGDGLMHVTAMSRCLDAVRALFATRPEITVGDIRDALGVSRKHAVPLLEYLDARRVTVRRGDMRIPGSGLAGNSPVG